MQRETWVVILVLLLAGGALYLHITTTTEEFSRHNIGWNGTSNLPAEYVRDLSRLDPGSTLLILAPDRPFTAAEVGYLRAFLDGGGRIIIADEEGAANPLLADLESEIRVRPGNLSSLERDYAHPGLFKGYVVENDTLFAGVETVLLNRPVAVEGGEPLVETSVFTWDDIDGDGHVGEGETFGRSVVCAREGNLIVLGDASLFINAMLPENPKFIENLQPVQIDAVHSRTGSRNPIINTLTWIEERPPAVAALAALAILPVAWRFGRKRE